MELGYWGIQGLAQPCRLLLNYQSSEKFTFKDFTTREEWAEAKAVLVHGVRISSDFQRVKLPSFWQRISAISPFFLERGIFESVQTYPSPCFIFSIPEHSLPQN